jgi:hypothetical protein
LKKKLRFVEKLKDAPLKENICAAVNQCRDVREKLHLVSGNQLVFEGHIQNGYSQAETSPVKEKG